jgi:signal transduction histidine kinase
MRSRVSRVPFDMREVVKMTSLEKSAITPWGRSAFYDSEFMTIGEGSETINLCEQLAAARFGLHVCSQCPVKARVESGATTLIRERCVMGVWRTLAPITVDGQVLGWISGPQDLDESCGDVSNLSLTDEVRQLIEVRKSHPIEADELKDRLLTAASTIGRLCVSERRSQIVAHTTARVRKTRNAADVMQQLFEGMRLLSPYADEQRFCVREGTVVNLVGGTGTHYHEESATLGLRVGHIGKAIAARWPRYERYLRPDDADFDQGKTAWRPKSVFTVPLQWGNEPAAVQIQSRTPDAFDEQMREAMELLITRAGNRGTLLLEAESRRLRALESDADDGGAQAQLERWDGFLLKTMLRKSASPFDLLTARRETYRRFNAELFFRAGDNCMASSIRILNPRSGVAGYMDCIGSEFTREYKDQTFTKGDINSLGLAVLVSGGERYERNLETGGFTKHLPSARSSWARRFKLSERHIGVATVSWKVYDGGIGFIDRLNAAFTQFELVLGALASSEEELIHELETAFTGGETIRQVGAELCDRVRRSFGARGCSLFLDRAGRKELTLEASTDAIPSLLGRKYYDFGEGITGWVAKHQKSVRLRHTEDEKERASVQHLHGIDEPIVRSENYKEDIEFSDARDRLSFVAAPLVARNRVLGVIRLTIKQDLSEFTHEEETFLQQVADRLAVALDARWRDEDATAKIEELEQQEKINAQVLRAQGLQSICKVLVDEVLVGARAAGAYVQVSHDDATVMETAGVFKALQAKQIGVPLLNGSEAIADIWISDEWTAICDRITLALGNDGQELAKAGVLLPLAGDQVRWSGAICIVWRNDQWKAKGRYQDFARRAASIIERTVEQIKLRQHIANLRTVGLAFGLEREFGRLMGLILNASLSEVGLSRGQVRLYDDERKVWRLVSKHDPSEPVPIAIETTETLRRCLESQKPVIIPDTQEDAAWIDYLNELPDGPQKQWLETARGRIAIPLIVGNRCLGAISIQSLDAAVNLEQHQLYLLEIIGSYAANAVYAAQLRKEVDLADHFVWVGKLLSGFLHVMGNKLNNAMASLSNLMLPNVSEPERRGLLDGLERDLNRIADIYSDLRVGFAPENVSYQHVDVNGVIQKAWADYRDQAPLRLTVIESFAPELPSLYCNEMEIEIAVRMLIQNALEVLAFRPGRLWLQTKSRRGAILVRIADDGPGMDPATKRSCLRPFFTTKGTKGKGLGLAVVVGVMARQKGTLRVSSKQGTGSVFSLVLPLMEPTRG